MTIGHETIVVANVDDIDTAEMVSGTLIYSLVLHCVIRLESCLNNLGNLPGHSFSSPFLWYSKTPLLRLDTLRKMSRLAILSILITQSLHSSAKTSTSTSLNNNEEVQMTLTKPPWLYSSPRLYVGPPSWWSLRLR